MRNLKHLESHRQEFEVPALIGASYYEFKSPVKGILRVIASKEAGFEHVSVSLFNRCPVWDEMCFIKNLFFEDEEECIQYHPKKSEYVNLHPHCLHIYRPVDFEYPRPEFA